MTNKVQYALTGAVLAVFVLAGAWLVWSSPARGDLSPAHAAPANGQPENAPDRSAPLPHPPVVEPGVAGVETDPPVEAPAAEAGTIDNPWTDKDAILAHVAEFARRQEQALLGREGWLRVAQTFSSSKPAEGDYYSRATDELIPVASLVPQNPTFETWYHVNEAGAYIEGLSLVTSQEGTIHQQTLLVDGAWLNLTLRGPDAYRRKQYGNTVWVDEPILIGTVTHNTLEQERDWPNIAWQAYSDGGQFTLITEQHTDSPIRADDFTEEPVLGVRTVYVFDEASGRLLSREWSYLLESGSVLPGETHHLLVEEFLTELPAETARLFDEAIDQVAESR